ncbi:hypothetical protein ASZ78_013916 [Callipepla squamata]|uniref:RanBD1 domain-containing protein n=1 Tax=Callipepla squamata TaxID=9009 RepID=A0A226M9I6_CALSU|nr:hypothetical protein ASZ78_013916 [Callipepla squamata]
MFKVGNTSGTGSLFGFSFKPPGKSRDSILTFQKAEQKEMGVAELPKSSSAPRKPSGSKASNSAPSAQDGPSNFSFKVLEKVGTPVQNELESECVTTLEIKPPEKGKGETPDVPSMSVCGVSSNVNDEDDKLLGSPDSSACCFVNLGRVKLQAQLM